MNDSSYVVSDPIQSDLFGGTVVNTKRTPKHKTPSLVDDLFETPDDEVYYPIINKVRLLGEEPPELDVFAMHDRGDGKTNSKCIYYLTEEYDSLSNDWLIQPSQRIPASVWVNDKHSKHKLCVQKAVEQYGKYGFTIVYIMPSNTRRTEYWRKHIEPYRFGGDPEFRDIPKHIHNFPFYYNTGTIRFVKDGKPTVNEDPTSPNFGKPQTSRNSYEVLVWTKIKSTI